MKYGGTSSTGKKGRTKGRKQSGERGKKKQKKKTGGDSVTPVSTHNTIPAIHKK